ncbi:MAG TPA: sigma-54 dependent transcriptional regulator [Candidatus Sumerlaeota bacterium]|nr:sigma-54 dependent transcriptional regulator [Candidatus Sumerlaeota bacterium]HPS00740.1 sigma-54 dependent transcriptional regulator [Candidatus Sumerlaeota bacterium]
MTEPFHILIADDEEGIRFVLREILTSQGYRVTEAGNGAEAIIRLKHEHFDLAILDVNMPQVNGFEILRQIPTLDPDLIPLVVTAYGSSEKAREAMQLGAYDYFTKPFDMEELRITIQRALEKKTLLNQILDLKSQVSSRVDFREIIGQSDTMRDVFNMMERVIDNDVPVLIMGESGTGKEMVVKAIHSRGPRQNGPLIKINCAAIPENLLESELFGHERGAFTGADTARQGKFELADGGTLFLDEIGEMPLGLQAKILRAVQESEIQRLGAKAAIQVNVRLITATNRNLAEEVAARRFREDLYYRINVVAIELPPLKRRLTDIPLLVDYFIEMYNQRLGKSIQGLAKDVMDIFLEYSWPGNIRELENVIQRSLIMATGTQILPGDLPPHMTGRAAREGVSPFAQRQELDLSIPMPDQVERVIEETERTLIREALRKTHGRQEAADLLGINRKSLHNKMLKYGMLENGL